MNLLSFLTLLQNLEQNL